MCLVQLFTVYVVILFLYIQCVRMSYVSKMAPIMAAVLQAPGKLCSFFFCLKFFLSFYVLDVVSITVYDRDTLLNIGSSVAQCKLDLEFLNAGGLFTDKILSTRHHQHAWGSYTGPLLHFFPGRMQVPPPPTFRQIGSLFRSAPACL